MALIDCPECGREVSSSAAVCPACAYPVGTGTATAPMPQRAVVQPPKHPWWRTAISLVGRVLVGGFLAAVGGGEEESAAAVIGGLIIAGSAIPVWYRSTIERLKARQAATTLGDRFEERMAELERRQQEYMDRFERLHAGQVAELEERIDFAERLLSKQRE